MSFWSNLKKKTSLKSILSGAKTALKLVPGGGIIAQGVTVLEKTVKSAVGGDKKKTQADKAVTQAVEEKTSTLGLNPVVLVAGAVALYFLMFAKK